MTAFSARLLAWLMTLEAAVGYPKGQNVLTINSTTSQKGEIACSADLKVGISRDAILLSMTATLIYMIPCKRAIGANQKARVAIVAKLVTMAACQARMLALLMGLVAAVENLKVQNAEGINSVSADLKVTVQSEAILLLICPSMILMETDGKTPKS
jgi:hypothetical protein